ncbi:TerC/Alx family metal homeostasis membrane protein [Segniliparus rugosus]|uniref:TerC family integral membrane protein n=1 Tax=Segniliparus rugosus (strain ATCC BAA-974 / DSM 45345 / CCUG 50838 / CIP 108380 / JCM 13579 / CDC 945) TaxID=679197 RepID=E5XM97_SEGRC|nr:TerC/Alx family metal homeostasis membrane protein [Segniliparus rugosus]EFV14523.1 TerC family integral membrane protein [Segniliparus rugosus ATCC BAA-974]
MPSPLIWTVTVALLLVLFAFDFIVQARKAHEPSTREAALWCGGYFALALVFGAAMAVWWDSARATEFVAGYVTELSLSVDNLFVFLLIMSRNRIPRERQQKVLLLGIAIALAARAVFIFLGAAVINAFSWTFYLFGAYLVFVALRLAFQKEESHDVEPETESRMARLLSRWLPVTRQFHGGALVAREGGKLLATPILLALVTLGLTDVLFALDSIPAIYGLTDQSYIVLTANAFALMGLRQLYFLIGGLLDRLVYLSYGLAAILVFIGAKLILHAAHESGAGVPEISTPLSLAVIASVLVVVVAASLVKTRGPR